MKRVLISTISFGLLAGAFLSPAMAAGPRVSDATDWPGMAQPVNPGGPLGYQPGEVPGNNTFRPDAAAKCGVYDNYCYYGHRLSLDNTGINR